MEKQIIHIDMPTKSLLDSWAKSAGSRNSYEDILKEIGVINSEGDLVQIKFSEFDNGVLKIGLSSRKTMMSYAIELGFGTITSPATIKTTRNIGVGREEKKYKCDVIDGVVLPRLADTNIIDSETKVILARISGVERDEFKAAANKVRMNLTMQYPNLSSREEKHSYVDLPHVECMMRNFQTYTNTVDFFAALYEEAIFKGMKPMQKISLSREVCGKQLDYIESIENKPGDFMLTESTFVGRVNKDGSWECSYDNSPKGITTIKMAQNGVLNYNLATSPDGIPYFEKASVQYDDCQLIRVPQLIKTRDEIFSKIGS